MLLSQYEPLLSASTRDELHSLVTKITNELGFKTFTLTTFSYRSDGNFETSNVHNIPDEYLDTFMDPAGAHHDPVMSHCRTSSLPIVWTRDTYLRAGQPHVHDTMAGAGFSEGICTALHLPNGRHVCFGLDTPDRLPARPNDLAYLVSQVQLLAVHLQETAFRLILTSANVGPTPRLTTREVEVLKWAMDGKTAWETGKLLSISERTAIMHITNAMKKLGATKRSQAVVKAYQLGLLA